ncbi:MAG TPA: hypothetical protein VGP48_14810 [Stellaceae bacterium]|jgi:hypothetical protein|nr:hypothetical protein [Stellaceae bacterium]
MRASEDEIALAISVTGAFENKGDPYISIAGDFDGMGISCGVLQWNLGCNSLQPLIQSVGEAAVRRAMPLYGDTMWRICQADAAAACSVARGWQTNAALQDAPAAELRALLGSREMRQVQRDRIAVIADKADALARVWASDQGRAARTIQELVWFFDLVTQNGSMRGIGAKDVAAFLDANGAAATSLICDWLAAAPPEWWGRDDCVKNAALWRAGLPPASIPLFVLGYLRSAIASEARARGVAMNRKGTIAAKTGFVNGTRFDFADRF